MRASGLATKAAQAAFGAVMVVSLALRLPRMSESIWFDEYCRTHAVLNSDRVMELLLHDVHNPLYNAFMYVWIGVFGDSEWSIRVPSLVAGYASLLLFCDLLRRRAGAWAAWGVFAWGALAPVHVWYSTEAKNNMFVLALATVALWCVDRMIERPSRVRMAAAAAAQLGAFYTDLIAVLVIIPLLAWPFGVAKRTGAVEVRRAGAIVGAAVIAGAVPWMSFKAMHVHDLWRGYLELFRPREVVELLGGFFATGNALTPLTPARTWMAAGVFVLLLPLMVLGARSLWRAGRSRIFVVLLMFGISGMAIASAVVDALCEGEEHFIYQPRNLLCLLYVFGAVLWTGVSRVRPGALRAAAGSVILGVTLAASVVMLSVHRDRFTVDKPRSDWRAVARVVETDAGGARVIAVSRSPVLQLERYSDAIEVYSSWGKEFGTPELAAADTGARLYFVDDLDWWPAVQMESWTAEYSVGEVARVDRVVVYHLERRR